jgi:alpha-1,2-mannosyltransferase
VLWPAVIAIAVGGLAVATWAHARSSDLLGMLVAADVALLISPITWTHHMVWVLPALFWLTLSDEAPRFGGWIAAGALVLFWLPPTWSVPTSWWPSADPVELHEHGWQLVAGNCFFFVTAMFLVGVGLYLWRRHDVPSARGLLRLLRG